MSTICWFSAGAASAVATKLTLRADPNADICYQHTGAEHPDNERFLADCEQWFGKPITRIKSQKYEDTWDVWTRRRFIAGVYGAPCTAELKRIPAEDYLFSVHGVGTWEVFGFTLEERARMVKWQRNNNERFIWPILIDRGYTKADCLAVLREAGIEIPVMYGLGYRNNNCIGCPKGQSGYWNKIRVDFPDVFDRMSKLERELNVAICKTEPTVNGKRQRIRVFLDELDPGAGRYSAEPDIQCGIFCMSELETMS